MVLEVKIMEEWIRAESYPTAGVRVKYMKNRPEVRYQTVRLNG